MNKDENKTLRQTSGYNMKTGRVGMGSKGRSLCPSLSVSISLCLSLYVSLSVFYLSISLSQSACCGTERVWLLEIGMDATMLICSENRQTPTHLINNQIYSGRC